MMNEIEWAEQAFEKLTHLINANLAAKEWIAAVLRLINHIPADVGESREADERVWFVAPLVISYRVDNVKHLVTIDSIRDM
jgi:hypothetical protein